MKPTHVFTDDEREVLHTILSGVTGNPYTDYQAFSDSVAELADREATPPALLSACRRIRDERTSGTLRSHVLRNCPLDRNLPVLSLEHADSDRYTERSTFVGEAFVALTARLAGMPLMAYRESNSGRFFDDVIAIRSHSGKQSAFSDSDLVYHNDRSAHWARPDQVFLLAMRSPDDEIVYTSYADGRDMLERLSPQHKSALRESYFITPFPAKLPGKSAQAPAEPHPILKGEATIRYVDTITTVAPGAPAAAKDALLAIKNALVLAKKQRHRLITGDLLLLENQEGLHCRDIMEAADPGEPRARWLLKVYSFRDDNAADAFAGKWSGGIHGLIPG